MSNWLSLLKEIAEVLVALSSLIVAWRAKTKATNSATEAAEATRLVGELRLQVNSMQTQISSVQAQITSAQRQSVSTYLTVNLTGDPTSRIATTTVSLPEVNEKGLPASDAESPLKPRELDTRRKEDNLEQE